MHPGQLKIVPKAYSTASGSGEPVPGGGGSRSGFARAEAILPLQLVGVGLVSDRSVLLEDVHLEFSGSKTSVILGPNGAGKTLLLRVCHGLLSPDRGEVRWRNPRLAMQPASQGMVFQKPVVLRRSVRDNIRFALQVCRIDPTLQADRLRYALEVSGLFPIANRRAMHLSGGEQQRLTLARCLAVQHRVLFLDEPTAHLDPTATRRVEEMIHRIRLAGTRVIMVTHDIGQARRLGDHIVFMHRGRVLESCSSAEFFPRPSSPEAAAYLAGELLW